MISGATTPTVDRRTALELVVVAASTGGPEALAKVFAGLPRSFPVPIVVVQHMPPVFTAQLAGRLATLSGLMAVEATAETVLVPGLIAVAPGDFHLVVRRRGVHLLATPNRDPHENSCRPSADVTFRTAASTLGGGVLGVVLTGLGRDGCAGARAVVAAGGRVIVQDQATSVAWGMPGAVANEGLAERILPITDIAPAIITRAHRLRGATA